MGFKGTVLALMDEPFYLTALDPKTGEFLWQSDNIHGPLELDWKSERLFSRTFRQEVVRLDPDSGARLWTSKPEGVPLRLQATKDGVLSGSIKSHKTGASQITMFDADTGSKRWAVDTYGGRFAASESRVYVPAATTFPSDRSDEISVLEMDSGQKIGSFATKARALDPIFCNDDHLFVRRLSHHNYKWDLVAFDLQSGKVAWTHESSIDRIIPGAEGQLYAVGERSVFCFDAASGHLVWKGYAGSDPELDVRPDGTVITRSQFGELRAFHTPDLRERALESEETFEFKFEEDQVTIGDFTLPRND